MAAVAYVPEPRWFIPNIFFNDVIAFALRELQEMDQPSLNSCSVEHRTAIREVGKAVFTLQVIMRPRLRSLFLGSMRAIAGFAEHQTYEQLFDFMRQGYLHKDIYKTILTCFAIIGELLLFLDEFGMAIPYFWQAMPWVNIYRHRLRDELSVQGGWPELVRKATRWYTETELFSQTRTRYRNHLPIQHAEVFFGDDPEDPIEFVQNLFEVAPGNTVMAMAILHKIYQFQPDMVPPPEEMFLVL